MHRILARRLSRPITRLATALSAALLCAPVWAGDTVQLLTNERLRMQPDYASPALMDVQRRSTVQILESRQDWVRVEAAGNRSGWVRRSSLDLPAPEQGARTQAATSPAALLPHSTPRASNHALIISIAQYADPGVPGLPGAAADIRNARNIAALMGVPDANQRILSDADASLDGIRRALADLDARMGDRDRALIHLAGHGTRARDTPPCDDALLTHDGQAFTQAELRRHLRSLASRADKIFVIDDRGRGEGPAANPKSSTARSRYFRGAQVECSFADRDGDALPPNLLHLRASRRGETAQEDAAQGGLATQAWLACLSGQSRPESPAGLPDGEALRRCAQNWLTTHNPAQHLELAGNPALIPAPLASTDYPVDPAALLRALQSQADGRHAITATAAAKPADGELAYHIESTKPGFVYVLGADEKALRLLYPQAGTGPSPIDTKLDIRLPLGGPGEHRLLLVTDAPRNLQRGGFVSDGRDAIAEGKRLADAAREFLGGDTRRLCQFGETRNLGPSQARQCSTAYAARSLDEDSKARPAR